MTEDESKKLVMETATRLLAVWAVPQLIWHDEDLIRGIDKSVKTATLLWERVNEIDFGSVAPK